MCLVWPGYADQNKSTLSFVITDKHTEAIYFTEFKKKRRNLLQGVIRSFPFISRQDAIYNAICKKALFYLFPLIFQIMEIWYKMCLKL